jgi:hypothetical protein
MGSSGANSRNRRSKVKRMAIHRDRRQTQELKSSQNDDLAAADTQLGTDIQASMITLTQPYVVLDFHIRPAMMLTGYTPQDIVSLIDRGASAQHILPTGDGYFIRTTDASAAIPAMPIFARWSANGITKTG